MRSIANALQSIVTTLWVGGLWTTGYIVAPVLFAQLEDRALAGLIAGRLFSLVAWIGIACALYLIGHRLARHRADALRQPLLWIVVAMLVLTLAGEFGMQPLMAELKRQAFPLPVMESALRDRFAAWHGVASVSYLVQSLLGAALAVLTKTEKNV